ncbi:MAG: glycosyltransferase family 2 protein [Candidatus Omnitrophica bacterium]|nr:glycosyltransferase family 2 protein [Candidatus Omnitrophota bacterium]MBU0895054.1 glycosyltransferase family 2 protein [Candidatus Omnitrophota bacterium]MBU1037986.1 glycosyltransferase family 2 protein [Candidatus Omnitrophota bacterium]MBU1808044.1 glycosyltransferase family 2 protein [Candidatus Omnitrophota bacterium]
MRKGILSVVMPVYNEKNTVLKIIEKVLKLEMVKELIVVDDGSTDGTKDILKNTKLDPRVKVLLHEKNSGKGAALSTGFKAATGEIVTVQDADLEYDPNEFMEMAKPIEDGMADVVYGSRLSGGKPQRVHMFWHKAGNTLLTFTMNLLYNSTLSDIETCYKMFRKEVIARINIRSKDFSVEPELTAKILKDKSLRIYEIPISYYGRSYAEGKKISWKDGFGALWTILKYRFID